MSQPHQPARKVGQTIADDDLTPGSERYPDIPTDEPGLVGGPATQAVPGVQPGPLPLGPAVTTDDGGETTLAGRPRETGGERPPKSIPKTDGS